MKLSNMAVRETTANEFVIDMLLTSVDKVPVNAALNDDSPDRLSMEFPAVIKREPDFVLAIHVRCLLPN